MSYLNNEVVLARTSCTNVRRKCNIGVTDEPALANTYTHTCRAVGDSDAIPCARQCVTMRAGAPRHQHLGWPQLAAACPPTVSDALAGASQVVHTHASRAWAAAARLSVRASNPDWRQTGIGGACAPLARRHCKLLQSVSTCWLRFVSVTLVQRQCSRDGVVVGTRLRRNRLGLRCLWTSVGGWLHAEAG